MPHNINRTASSQDTSFKPSRTLNIKQGKVRGQVEVNSKSVEKTANSNGGSCCTESSRKIKELEKLIDDLKSEIELLRNEREAGKKILLEQSNRNEIVPSKKDKESQNSGTQTVNGEKINTFVSEMRQETNYTIPTENSFAVLSEINSDNNHDNPEARKNGSDKPINAKCKQSILIGDRQVRCLAKNFCPESKKKIVNCYPNITVKSAVNKNTGILSTVIKSEENATVIVNLGSYDVLNCQTKDIKSNMKYLISELKSIKENRDIKIAEIVPHLYNKGLNKKIKIVNNHVKSLCDLEQIGFIEYWNKFENDIRMYVRDGSQLNKKGKSKLGNILTENCPEHFLE